MIIHPALVHFPIAFYLLEGFLLVLGRMRKNPSYDSFAYLVFNLALGFHAAAAVAGLYDAGWFAHLEGKTRTHLISAVTLGTLSLFRWALWKKERKLGLAPSTLLIASAGLSIGMTLITAWLGGELVY